MIFISVYSNIATLKETNDVTYNNSRFGYQRFQESFFFFNVWKPVGYIIDLYDFNIFGNKTSLLPWIDMYTRTSRNVFNIETWSNEMW